MAEESTIRLHGSHGHCVIDRRTGDRLGGDAYTELKRADLGEFSLWLKSIGSSIAHKADIDILLVGYVGKQNEYVGPDLFARNQVVEESIAIILPPPAEGGCHFGTVFSGFGTR